MEDMSPQQYIAAVKRKDLYDPILTFQLSNDFEVKQVLKGYLPEDKESQGYATLLEWFNIYYEPEKPMLFGAPKTTARIACVQWQMREFLNVEDVVKQAEYFINALSDYRCDVALYNVAYLCRRDGTVEAQYKIHPTPHF